MDSTPRLPLTGMQVVECASYVAGPTGGLTLAQLGAEVVRIDPLGGGHDYLRWPLAPSGESYYWSSLNKGKRSVAVDLRSPEGQELVVALITAPGPDRGLLIDNVVGRPWLAHDALEARRPDLIHLRVQGHPDGRPAVDYTVNAERRRPSDHRAGRGSRRNRAGQPRAPRLGPDHRRERGGRACWPRCTTASAPATAPSSSSPCPTWRWPGCPTSGGCRRRSCAAATGPGTATTCTAASPPTSPAATASG